MKKKWYQSFYFTQDFPLKPKVYKVDQSEYNILIYKFRWLFFIFELSKNFHFSVDFHATTYRGIGITIDIPYIRLGFRIELPSKVKVWVWANLERDTKFRKEQLKELLEQVDENLEIVVYDDEDIEHTINLDDSGEIIFSVNCDEEGNLLRGVNGEKCFMLRVEY